MAQTNGQGTLERFFKLKEHNTTVRTEVVAGITTFVAMAYICLLYTSKDSDSPEWRRSKSGRSRRFTAWV